MHFDVVVLLWPGRFSRWVFRWRDAAALTLQILCLVDVILVAGEESQVVPDDAEDHDPGFVPFPFEPIHVGRDPRESLTVVRPLDALVLVAEHRLSPLGSIRFISSEPRSEVPRKLGERVLERMHADLDTTRPPPPVPLLRFNPSGSPLLVGRVDPDVRVVTLLEARR